MSSIASFWNKSETAVSDKFNDGVSGVNINSNEYFSSFTHIFKGIFKQNIDDQFQIPKICVIGNTSSGKSSLLENITKTPIFPRNKTLCTKQPIHLTLKNNDIENYTLNKSPINKDDIRKTIEDEFLKNQTIVNQPIDVCISGKDLIDFEFIDFPGLCSHPPDLKELSISLIESHLKDNNIILCVIPSNVTHLSSYAPIALIEKYNMKKNTILVFTMADKVIEEDIGENILARILNESDEIDTSEYLACSVIINRSHTNNKSLVENDRFSDQWFNKNVLDKIPDSHDKKDEIKSMLGVRNLINNLNLFYKKFIDNKWIPNTISRLESNICNCKKELNKLGINPCLIDKAKFTKHYINSVIPDLINYIKDTTYSFEYTDFNDFKLFLEHINDSIDKYVWPNEKWLSEFKLIINNPKINVNKEKQNSDKDRNYNWTELCIQSSSSDSTKSNFNKDMAVDAECQDRHDENELYDNYNLNIVRFTDINNSIIAILTRIYKEKLKYFVDISKSNIMSNMREFIMHSYDCKTFTGENSAKEDIKLQHSMSIYEMLNIDYTKFNLFELIEESEEFVKIRSTLNDYITEYSSAINKLLELKNNTNCELKSIDLQFENNEITSEKDTNSEYLVEEMTKKDTDTTGQGIFLEINSGNLLTPENLISSVS